MAATHTKGPWRLLPLEDGVEYLRIRGTQLGLRYKVCNVHAPFQYNADEVLESQANARLIAAAPDLLAACVNARDMLSTDRQAFVDCQRLRDGRTDDPVAHGLTWVDDETWIAPEDAEPLRDYDRAIALIDAAIAKATGEAP